MSTPPLQIFMHTLLSSLVLRKYVRFLAVDWHPSVIGLYENHLDYEFQALEDVDNIVPLPTTMGGSELLRLLEVEGAAV